METDHTDAETRLAKIRSHFAYEKNKYTPDSYINRLFGVNMEIPDCYTIKSEILIDDLDDDPIEVIHYTLVKLPVHPLRGLYDIITEYPNNRIIMPTTGLLRDLANQYCSMINNYLDIYKYRDSIFQLVPLFVVGKNLLCYADNPNSNDEAALYSRRFVHIKLHEKIDRVDKRNAFKILAMVRDRISLIHRSLYTKSADKDSDWIYPTDLNNCAKSLENILYYFKINRYY